MLDHSEKSGHSAGWHSDGLTHPPIHTFWPDVGFG